MWNPYFDTKSYSWLVYFIIKREFLRKFLYLENVFKKFLERYLGKFLWGLWVGRFVVYSIIKREFLWGLWVGQGFSCFLWWETFCSYLLGNRNSDSVGLSKTSRETRVGVSWQPEVLSIFWIYLCLLFSACKLRRRTQWVQRPQCIPSGADWGN